MRGAEHYREAERRIDQAAQANDTKQSELLLAEAQVHATLAQAAAIADSAASIKAPNEWHKAIHGGQS